MSDNRGVEEGPMDPIYVQTNDADGLPETIAGLAAG
jgi:hypothetical protein